MTVIGEGYVAIRPKTEAFEAEASSGVGGALKKVAAGVAGIFAVKEAVEFGEKAVEAFNEAETAGLKLNSALAKNPATIHDTAAAFDDLNKKQMEHTKFNTEASQSIEGQLAMYHLTAGQIKELTPLVEDYAARTGKDVSEAAKLAGAAILGKGRALKDVGIAFKDMKDPMANYTELTKGLRDQVGGFAEKEGATFQGRMEIMKNQAHEFMIEVGSKLVPVLSTLAGFMLGKVLPALEEVGGWIGEKIKPYIEMVRQLIDVMFKGDFKGGPLSEDSPIIDTAFKIRDAVKDLMADVKAFFYTLTSGFTEDEGTPIERVALTIRNLVLPAFHEITDFVSDHAVPILITLGVTVGLLVAPWAMIAGGLIYAYTHFQVFHEVVDKVVHVLKNDVIPIVEKVGRNVVEQLGNAVQWVVKMWPQISEAIGHVMVVVKDVVLVTLAIVYRLWQDVGQQVFAIVVDVWNAIYGVIRGVMEVIRGIIQTVVALINGDWGKAWDGIKEILRGVWDAIFAIIKNILPAIWQVIQAAMHVIEDILRLAWDGIKWAVDAAWRGIKELVVWWITQQIDFITALPGRIVSILAALPGLLWNTAKWAFDTWNNVVTSTLGWLFGWLQGVPGAIVGAIGDLAGWLWNKAKGAFDTLNNAAIGALTWLFGWLRGLPGSIVDSIGDLAGWLYRKARGAFDTLNAGAIDAFNWLVGWLRGIPGTVVGAIGDIAGSLWHVGTDMIWGFIHGIQSMAGQIIDAIKHTITDALPGFVKNALHISSPSKVFHELGAAVAAGFANGIRAGASDAIQAAQEMVDGISGVGGGIPAMGGAYGAAARGGNTYNVRVSNSPTLVDENRLVTLIRRAELLGQR